MDAIQLAFDYNALDADTSILVRQRTDEIRGLMKRAAQDIIDIGQKLIEVRDLLRHNKAGGFDGWLRAEFDWDGRTAYRFINVATNFDNLSGLSIAPSALYLLAAPSTPEAARIEALSIPGPITYGQAQEMAARHKAAERDAAPLPFTPEPSAYDAPVGPPPWESYQGGWVEDDEEEDDPGLAFDTETQQAACKYCYTTHSDWGATGEGAYECNRCGHATHEDSLDISPIPDAPEEHWFDRPSLQTMHPSHRVLHSNSNTGGSNEWYTPAVYLEAARAVMGGIDLDPASCEYANRMVQAARFYTEADDGYRQPWAGRMWMNPPYGKDEETNQSNQALWIQKLIAGYRAGEIEQALVLINAVTDRKWFLPLWDFPLCFTGRVYFYNETITRGSPTHGSVIAYFGPNLNAFIAVYRPLGRLVIPCGWWNESLEVPHDNIE